MNVSLLHGWLPITVELLAVLALLTAIGWRDRTWRLRRLPRTLAVAVLVTVIAALSVTYLSGNTDPLPTGLWIWLGVTLVALAVLVAGGRGTRWWQGLAGVLAVLLGVVSTANVLNVYTGYYPTVGSALGSLTNQPLTEQISYAKLPTVPADTTTGRVVSVEIKPTHSGFAHRRELVYLPPVWFRSKPHPKLPVLMMIGGEYSAPDNWIRTGDAVKTAEAYAAAHDGLAPVMVFPDATGGFKNDTECVNGPAGKAEDHLVKDVPPWMEKVFGTSKDPKQWGVGGWSMGGTCALTLVVTHPGVFGHFFDVSGDMRPNLGSHDNTVAKLYGGDAAGWDKHEPITVMAKHGPYNGVSGWFEIADSEPQRLPTTKQLDDAAVQAGISTKMNVEPGKHTWQFGAAAFQRALPWLADQLNLAGTHVPSATPTPSPTATAH